MNKISVLMGIYNCESTLEEAVNCIINQTYQEWELILCDDGSTDKTFRIAEQLSENDDRIILLKNEHNVGLNKTLNKCLKKATGNYIARMDGDDKCSPSRFEKQLRFLQEHNEYDIVSSGMTFFDSEGTWGKLINIAEPTKEDVVVKSPICHAPVMMTKSCIDDVHGYTEDIHMLRVEDVNLWIKLYAKGYKCYNLQETLYYMRNDKNALNRRKYKYRINSSYVRLLGCKELHLKPIYYIKALKPMIIGLVPSKIRATIRRAQWR